MLAGFKNEAIHRLVADDPYLISGGRGLLGAMISRSGAGGGGDSICSFMEYFEIRRFYRYSFLQSTNITNHITQKSLSLGFSDFGQSGRYGGDPEYMYIVHLHIYIHNIYIRSRYPGTIYMLDKYR